ncbi:histidinol-phosphate transaminase [Sphaerotilus microaerophilus]|uniref:Histidinol-phosphate aminotransferase n=1 Tax=Sphaerotilus microaerophilus TaxID=2914710 RepID=A0ABN6PGK5_9BURK|nr:histidinol-phosphate transaminase [Sphaerotilus sp. FB-5]BDI03422.1 histidinol-phosphate aminotransferase 1 [Sphaerotilus sp. FB-5]
MSRFWSPLVHQLSPYVPGEQPKLPHLVKLNTNENPYPPSPAVQAAIQAELGADAARLRLYPDPSASALRASIAAAHGLTPEQVFVGNGSDEVLAHAFMALLNHRDAQGAPRPLLYPDITYSFYPTYCRLYGITPLTVPLDERFQIRVDDLIAAARASNAGGVIFPNPNAPTGCGIARSEIERLLTALPDCVVVVDEAYVDFGAESALPLIAAHPNLLVVHTLSKSRSLAGLRVGFAAGQAELVEALVRVKDSFNSYPLDRLALVGAQAAIEDVAWFEQTRGAVIRSRELLVTELAALGFEVLPSQANFVFARHPAHAGAALQQALRERAIIVRHFTRPERIANHLRITVGTPAECAALVEALRQIV